MFGKISKKKVEIAFCSNEVKMSYSEFFFFFKQKPAYDIVSRDWSSDVCSSDLL